MPEERRPVDVALKDLTTKSEDEQIAWWTTRLGQVADIPVATARAGAMIPISRELQTLPHTQRLALLRTRILAFAKLPADQQDKLNEARPMAFERAPDVTAAEAKFVLDQVVPTLPPELAERVKTLLARAQRT